MTLASQVPPPPYTCLLLGLLCGFVIRRFGHCLASFCLGCFPVIVCPFVGFLSVVVFQA